MLSAKRSVSRATRAHEQGGPIEEDEAQRLNGGGVSRARMGRRRKRRGAALIRFGLGDTLPLPKTKGRSHDLPCSFATRRDDDADAVPKSRQEAWPGRGQAWLRGPRSRRRWLFATVSAFLMIAASSRPAMAQDCASGAAFTGPIRITSGGTYTGNWQSPDRTTPVVQIFTTNRSRSSIRDCEGLAIC